LCMIVRRRAPPAEPVGPVAHSRYAAVDAPFGRLCFPPPPQNPILNRERRCETLSSTDNAA
jgi:hypothetical protein